MDRNVSRRGTCDRGIWTKSQVRAVNESESSLSLARLGDVFSHVLKEIFKRLPVDGPCRIAWVHISDLALGDYPRTADGPQCETERCAEIVHQPFVKKTSVSIFELGHQRQCSRIKVASIIIDQNFP